MSLSDLDRLWQDLRRELSSYEKREAFLRALERIPVREPLTLPGQKRTYRVLKPFECGHFFYTGETREGQCFSLRETHHHGKPITDVHLHGDSIDCKTGGAGYAVHFAKGHPKYDEMEDFLHQGYFELVAILHDDGRHIYYS